MSVQELVANWQCQTMQTIQTEVFNMRNAHRTENIKHTHWNTRCHRKSKVHSKQLNSCIVLLENLLVICPTAIA